jgi:hypothetical protein
MQKKRKKKKEEEDLESLKKCANGLEQLKTLFTEADDIDTLKMVHDDIKKNLKEQLDQLHQQEIEESKTHTDGFAKKLQQSENNPNLFSATIGDFNFGPNGNFYSNFSMYSFVFDKNVNFDDIDCISIEHNGQKIISVDGCNFAKCFEEII